MLRPATLNCSVSYFMPANLHRESSICNCSNSCMHICAGSRVPPAWSGNVLRHKDVLSATEDSIS